MIMKYVIIGNGTAAVGAVEGIRQNDTDGNITIISAEKHHVYARPLISYYLEGKTDRERMLYRPKDFYEKNKCELITGHSAKRIDTDRKAVFLDSGEILEYDKLCVAAGSSAFVPKFDGLDTVRSVHTFMTLDDALALERDVDTNSKVLIIGAGLIGLKCAEGLSSITKNITVTDISNKVLSSILDNDSSDIVKQYIEKNGIDFMLGDSVTLFDGNTAIFKSGKKLEFDILVIAVGVKPNISLISNAGGDVDRGIKVDEYMQTSLPDVYAAGDCTESHDMITGGRRIIAILPNAYMQGETAGKNMSGAHEKYNRAFAMNAIGFFGLHLVTAGVYDGEVYTEKQGDNLKKIFYKDNLVRGFIITGNVEKAGIYTSLIRDRIPIDKIDFSLICKKPTFLAFQDEYRKNCFGGVV